MPQGAGYFWGGLAQGIQTGINYKMQLDEAKERKRLREEEKQLEAQLLQQAQELGKIIDSQIADGDYSYEDYISAMPKAMALSQEIRKDFVSIINDLYSGNVARAKQELELVKYKWDFKSQIDYDRLSPEAFDAWYNDKSSEFSSPEARMIDSIAKERERLRFETRRTPEELAEETAFKQAGVLPQEVRPEYLRQKGIPIPEVPTELQRKFAEIDKMPGLPEDAKLRAKLKALGISESPTEEKIRLAYQMGASDEDIRDYIILGKRPTTAGTATAQKETQKYSINDARVISDAMDLYDFVTSAYGAPTALTEEQKQNILQSVQSMQAGLQPPVYTLLVNMLDMGGYLPSGTPTPAPENKKESSLLQDAVSWVKAKFNQWFGGNPPQPTPSQPTEMQPAPSVSEIPRMPTTVPTTTPGTQGTKNYQDMTDDELYNLAVTEQDGLAYDELKRRGYPLP